MRCVLELAKARTRPWAEGLGFRAWGFRALGSRALGFRALGFRVWGFWV